MQSSPMHMAQNMFSSSINSSKGSQENTEGNLEETNVLKCAHPIKVLEKCEILFIWIRSVSQMACYVKMLMSVHEAVCRKRL